MKAIKNKEKLRDIICNKLCLVLFTNKQTIILPICNRCICTVFRDRFVSRADDLVYVDELLNTVGAPAGDTGDCEHRCKEFFRQIKHGVYETAVEIDIRAYTFIDLALVCDDFLRNLSDIHIKLIFFFLVLFLRQFSDKGLEYIRTWIGDGIYGMSIP